MADPREQAQKDWESGTTLKKWAAKADLHAELERAHHLWLVTSDIEERIEMAGMAPSVEIPTLMLVSWLANLKRAQLDGIVDDCGRSDVGNEHD